MLPAGRGAGTRGKERKPCPLGEAVGSWAGETDSKKVNKKFEMKVTVLKTIFRLLEEVTFNLRLEKSQPVRILEIAFWTRGMTRLGSRRP